MSTSIPASFDPAQFTCHTATEADLPVLADLRFQFALEMHPVTDPGIATDLHRDILAYLTARHRDGTYCGFLGYCSGQAVCCAGLLIYELPPLRAGEKRRQGHVLNFFTLPAYRRRGAGKALLLFLITESRKLGFFRLFLNATPEGEKLYRKHGFTEQEEKALILYL